MLIETGDFVQLNGEVIERVASVGESGITREGAPLRRRCCRRPSSRRM